MNIVQQQHDLEMMGVPELQKLAQGTNPNVPAYLALAVLNQKMASREKAGLASGAAQGQQRSVAEQVDQKAGLMALDQQKQQQAQQMMAQQAQQTPQAVPEGVPAPQPQAQAQPAMMASGGIARLPIDPRMTDYAEGGVVAFAAGGETAPVRTITGGKSYYLDIPETIRDPSVPFYRRIPNPRYAALSKKEFATAAEARQAYDTASTAVSRPAPGEEGIMAAAYKPRMTPGGEQREPTVPEEAPAGLGALPPAAPKPPAMPGAMPGAAPKPPAMPGATGPGLPSAMPKPPAMPGAPVAPPAAAGMQAQLAKEVATPGAAPTPEGIMAERATMMPEELKTPADAGLKQRTAAMEEQYQGSKKDRDFERMLAVLGGGAKGGMGGFAPAYLGAVQGERTADTAHAAEMNRLLSGGENVRRGEATSEYAGRTAGLTAAKTAFSDTERNRITALAQGAGIEQRAAEAMLSSLTQLEVARMQRATAGLPGETERITAKYMALKAKDPKAAEEFMAGIERAKGAGKANPQAVIADKAYDNVLARIASDRTLQGQYRKNPALFQAAVDAETKRLGGTIAAAPGAKSPGGNPADIEAILKQYSGGKQGLQNG
jgi:hypothetical protein